MPVDLSIPNSIIEAYAKGRAEFLQRQQQALQEQERQRDEEFRQKQLAQQQKQFEDTQKAELDTREQQHKEFLAGLAISKAHADLAKLQYLSGAQKEAASLGFSAGLTKLPSIEGLSLPTGKNIFIGDPSLGLGDTSFEVPTPEETANTQARLGTIERQPLRAEAREDFLFQTLTQSNYAKELENLRNANATQHDKEIIALENSNAKAMEDIKYIHDLGKIREEWTFRSAVQGATDFEPWTRLPVDKETSKSLGLPENSVWGDLGVTSLDTTGKKKFESYSGMEDEVIQLINIFKGAANAKIRNGQFPNTAEGNDKALQAAYAEYFSGAFSGTFQDLFPNYTSTEFTNEVKPHLGRIFLLAKEISNLGSALTETEKTLQSLFTLTGERKVTPDAAMKILNNALPLIRKSRYDTVISHGTGKKLGRTGPEIIKIR